MRYWFVGQQVEVVVDGGETGGRYSLVEMHIPQGYHTPLHVHRDADQVMCVLEGEQTVWIGDHICVLGEGDALRLPRSVPHTTRNSGRDLARVALLSRPAGFEAFVRAAGTPAPVGAPVSAGSPDMRRVGILALELGIELLGPPGMLPTELPPGLKTAERSALGVTFTRGDLRSG